MDRQLRLLASLATLALVPLRFASAQDAPPPGGAPPPPPSEQGDPGRPLPPPKGPEQGPGADDLRDPKEHRGHGKQEMQNPPGDFPPEMKGPPGAERKKFRPGKPLNGMPPEQSDRFRENVERWKKLPPDQQADLRKNEEFRRKRVEQEIDKAVASSGLKLDQKQRELFAFRFEQERRSFEEGLRKEMQEKRNAAVNKIVQQLVVEFKKNVGETAQPSPAPSASPAP